MRFLIPAAVLAVIAGPVLAQNTTTPATPQNPPAAETPAAPGAMAPAQHKRHRMTLQQRFDAANTTHDGHLTKDQATTAKWSYVEKNFDAIDKDHKGYVTVEEIHDFAAARHGHRTAPPAKS
jgi:hypothetical protein